MELVNYFDSRIRTTQTRKLKTFPFITISRETGCGSTKIAKQFVKALNATGNQWKYIDKEILNESARKLKLNKSKIKYIFDAVTKTHADEILGALSSRYYKSDKVVRKVISDVVKHYVEEGNVVLVGRGGAGITAGMKKGMHIRLVAPFSWRTESLVLRHNKSQSEIEEFIRDSDVKRNKLLKSFCKEKTDETCFDLTINCAKFSPNEIVDIIVVAMKQKELI
ncbi:MAG: cytidylate kinase-like family protein [Bacteroidetes bacterium]|nr:cytidylate kinase-like family protein [Bacteroidota bacterium]MBL6943892.1 cytidylate kinase-like family protein [Bacteroidales bacterium]